MSGMLLVSYVELYLPYQVCFPYSKYIPKPYVYLPELFKYIYTSSHILYRLS